eukprot:12938308-Alexandrium_andersonii.AAC.1
MSSTSFSKRCLELPEGPCACSLGHFFGQTRVATCQRGLVRSDGLLGHWPLPARFTATPQSP